MIFILKKVKGKVKRINISKAIHNIIFFFLIFSLMISLSQNRIAYEVDFHNDVKQLKDRISILESQNKQMIGIIQIIAVMEKERFEQIYPSSKILELVEQIKIEEKRNLTNH